jgi:hypothetical protein
MDKNKDIHEQIEECPNCQERKSIVAPGETYTCNRHSEILTLKEGENAARMLLAVEELSAQLDEVQQIAHAYDILTNSTLLEDDTREIIREAWKTEIYYISRNLNVEDPEALFYIYEALKKLRIRGYVKEL